VVGRASLDTYPVDPAPTYGALLRVRGFPALLAGTLAARTGESMLSIALILFALRDYHSATLAGLASFLWVFPALVVSPLAGALPRRRGGWSLEPDREHGRGRGRGGCHLAGPGTSRPGARRQPPGQRARRHPLRLQKREPARPGHHHVHAQHRLRGLPDRPA